MNKQTTVDQEEFSEEDWAKVAQLIKRFGEDEGRAMVLVNEFHGHLGVYAVMGVKMEIAAMEYLSVGPGDVSIHSYAGMQPPVSCMNDGFQVSTGATFGHGLISSPATQFPEPMADFKIGEQIIRVQLKDEIKAMIISEINYAVEQYGHKLQYWKHVRDLAIKCWTELDRKDIVEITEIT